MIEKRMNPNNFRLLVYIFGGLLEIIGFGLLFSFDKTMNYIHSFSFMVGLFEVNVFALVLIFAGYLCAVGVRRK